MKKVLFLLLIPLSLCGQNRVFDRPAVTGRSFLLDRGGGNMFIAREHRYNFDSTHVHLLAVSPDLVLSHIGGFRTLANLTWMNIAAPVSDGVIFGGASLAFQTWPYILRMDTTGNVQYCSYFSNLTDGQDQILSMDIDGANIDLFTWADNTRLSYYMLNGNINGTFSYGLQVHAPAGIELRVDDTEPTGNPHEFIVICQADTNNSFSKFLIVQRIDSAGVQWSYIHDHGTTMNFELEQGNGLLKLSDGNYIYNALYRGVSNALETRLVKLDGMGTVLWTKEYFQGANKLYFGYVYETSDAGMLLLASDVGTSESFILKLDLSGDVLWSQKFVPMSLSVNPLGTFFKNDIGQLYGYNNLAITEMDETINVCDMVPHTGITSMNVTFDVISVTSASTPIVPVIAPYTYSLRSNSYINVQTCVSSGVEVNDSDQSASVYPNPVSSELHIDFEDNVIGADVRIYNSMGTLVKIIEKEMVGSLIDISEFAEGLYFLHYHESEIPVKFIVAK